MGGKKKKLKKISKPNYDHTLCTKLILDFVILCMSYTELNLLTKMELDSVTHCTNTTMAQLLLRKWVWFTERRMGVHDRMLTHTRPTAKLFDFVF